MQQINGAILKSRMAFVRERAAGPHLAAVRPSLHFPPQPGHPGRSAAESRDLESRRRNQPGMDPGSGPG